MKKCSKCKEFKEITEFFKDKQKSSGFRPDCKSCNKLNSKNWAKTNVQQRRFNVLKSATGVTKEQYLDLLDCQDNKCAICKISIEENKRNLSVDHCHSDNYVRGLLCTKCNFGLGYFNDNEELLLNAIDYLNNNFKNKKIKYKC